MGNDFSSLVVTPVQARKLIAYEGAEARKPNPASLRHNAGILCSQVLEAARPAVDAAHGRLFRPSDHVGAIAAAAALASVLLALTSMPGLLSGLGFVLCAALINLACVVQADAAGRPQRTVLARVLLALCEGAVVGACVVWSRSGFVVGLVLVAMWTALQVVERLPTPVRPSAVDVVVLLWALALGGGGGDSLSAPTVMLAAASASLTGSIALERLLRAAGAVAVAPRPLLLGAVDVDLLLASGVSRVVLGVALCAGLFGGAGKYTFLCGVLAVGAVEALRVASLSHALRTPLFSNITTVYVDGVFDLCHIGHKNLINFAATLGNRVVAGVLSDEDCCVYKRAPVMTTAERVAEVTALAHVSRVVRGAPCFGQTEQFLRDEGIDVVVVGDEYMQKPVEEDKYYHVPRRMGIAVAAPRTGGISTSELIARIGARSASDLAAKDKASGASTVKV